MKKFLVAVSGLAAAVALVYLLLAPAFRGDNEVTPMIQVGGFGLRYYGLIMGVAVLCSYFLGRANAWRYGISREEVDRYTFWLILFSFLSARIYYVVFEYEYFAANPSEIIKIWNGGLAIFGALLGGLLFTYLYTRKKIYSIWQLLDLTALVVPLGQAIGRFGNFFNYEAYGTPTSLPWKMYIPEGYRNQMYASEVYFHPTFLYESVVDLLIFGIVFALRGRLKHGNLALTYLVLYSTARFIIEPIRLDSTFIGGLRVNQVMAGVLFVIAASILLYRNQKKIANST